MQKKALIYTIVIVVVVALGVTGFILLRQNSELKEFKEQMILDRQLLEEEFNDLSMQYEGYKFTVSNDSLLRKLEGEQAKVQRLMEELKTVKSNNAKRIGELKRELETLRKIMRHYVQQIDSLNKANTQLKEENTRVREQISKVTSTAQRLQAEKTALNEQVERASKLSVSYISVSLLDKRGKEVKKIKKAAQIRVIANIDRNVTAEVGEKTLYVRILKPDGEILALHDGTFSYENGMLEYSMKRSIEYDGEPVQVTLFWDISEYLLEGNYRADIFADGHLIGKKAFRID
ncbi:MAG: hypothetical protein Q3998_05555 [Porphyromonas sp.]|nr:hypothetical protein [Porphyromonas sp.]